MWEEMYLCGVIAGERERFERERDRERFYRVRERRFTPSEKEIKA